MNLREQLIGFEGWAHEAYPDRLTHGDPWTIGVGHTGPEVHEGLAWTDKQISDTLDADIAQALADSRAHFPWFDSLNEPRQAVIAGMCFQMGIGRLLRFVKMLGAVRDQRWPVAAEEMRQSVWAKQTAKRAIRLAYQMEAGAWA